jgi:hypothetical protein
MKALQRIIGIPIRYLLSIVISREIILEEIAEIEILIIIIREVIIKAQALHLGKTKLVSLSDRREAEAGVMIEGNQEEMIMPNKGIRGLKVVIVIKTQGREKRLLILKMRRSVS